MTGADEATPVTLLKTYKQALVSFLFHVLTTKFLFARDLFIRIMMSVRFSKTLLLSQLQIRRK